MENGLVQFAMIEESIRHERVTVKFLNNWTPEKIAVITLKIEQSGFTIEVMHPNDADRMANSVDPDQTAAISGSTLFAQTYLPEK